MMLLRLLSFAQELDLIKLIRILYEADIFYVSSSLIFFTFTYLGKRAVCILLSAPSVSKPMIFVAKCRPISMRMWLTE
ncbi:hypothetical protein EMIT048CA2_190034 [Pseudomonas chlororaphis]